jgi:hypothetical protein
VRIADVLARARVGGHGSCRSTRAPRASRALRDAIDDRAWDRLDEIFTPDAVFDLTDLGARRCEGLADIKRFMGEEAEHPRTHLMTNIYVDETARGVELRFRIVALLGGGKVGTASYYDDVVNTPSGWRVQHRVVTLRRRP